MNENRLNFPEIQDAHLDQMIRLAFAQEAALLAQEWMAQSETPETPQEQERAERLLRQMRAQIDREERAVRRRSRSARLRRIVPRVVEIAACVVLAVAVATPFAIANVEFIRSAVMKLLIRIDWDEGVMQMNLVEDEGAAFDVPADCFVPRPKVDSAVLKLTPLAQPAVETRDEKLFFALVRAAFNMRRKTLVNALGPVLASAMSKEEIVALVEAAGLDARIRGERLSLADYAKLADLASEKLNKG